MKKVLSIILGVLFVLVCYQIIIAATTATLSQVDQGADWKVFNATGSHQGADSVLTVSMPDGFAAGDWNDSPLTVVTASGEATADSIRYTLKVQGRSYPTATTWHTCQTFTDTNSTTPFVNVYNPATYGKFPEYRLVYTGVGAKTAVQTLTISVIVDKD